MKRNKLLNSPAYSRLFTNHSASPGKHRHLLILSLLAIAGISLTTIVLATSEPVSSTQSTIIRLPDQTTVETTPSDTPAATLKTTANPAENTINNLYSLPSATPEKTTSTNEMDRVANIERSQIELLNQQQASEQVTADVDTQDVATSVEITLDWHELTVKSGDNLSLLFPKVGLTARDVYNVAQTGDAIKPLLNLKPGQTMRFGLVHDAENKTKLQQLELVLSPIKKLQLTATDTGYQAHTETRETEKRQTQVAGQIENSLFGAGQKAGMSDKLIMEMAHIFGWDIDFALDIRQGDSFKVIYEQAFLDGKKFKDGDILAAEFTNQGKTFRAIRYTDDEGNSHFYSPTGDSMRKTFMRTPVHFSRISSKFNPNRKHPILKTSRPHNGVDYAAPTGTPILATGDGKVSFIGLKGGYGRVIILTHGGKYSTLYGHMSAFKKGLKRGQKVKQGQIIGYVGMSGLATGPHLHYEFRINGVHRNPLTVSLPKAEPLAAKYIDDFKRKSQPLLAKLEQLSQPLLAANQQ